MKSLGFALVLLGMLSVGCAEVSNVKCKLDLGLVVDKTRGIKKSNIPQVKEALQHLMQRFDISADKSHVSFLTFTEKSTLHNAFNNPTYHSQDAILALISSSLKKLRSPTRLDKAIKTAKDKMFTSENGLRPGVGRAMVLYTDGRSHPDSEEIHRDVAALKVKGVRIAVVGIGPLAKKTQYRKVLEDVGGENVFFVDDYNSLDDHTNDIMKIVCGVSTPSTVSSTSSSCNSCTTSSSVTPSSSLCHSCTTSSSVTTSSSESTSSSVSPSIFTLSSKFTSSSVSPSIIIDIFTDIFPWRRSSSATSSSSESTSSSVSPSVIIDIFTSSSSSSSSTASTSSSSSSTASTSESTSSSVSPSVINDIFTSSSSSSSSTASTSESTSSSVSPSVIIDIFTSSSSVTSSTASTSSASSSTASASVAAR